MLFAVALVLVVLAVWSVASAGAVAALTGLSFGPLLVAAGATAVLVAGSMLVLARALR